MTDYDDLRAKMDADRLVELARALGLHASGRDIHCPHPDHDDHNASAGIFTADGTGPKPAGHGRWMCHGGCLNAYDKPLHGDATEFVYLAREHESRSEAAEWLEDWLARQPDVERLPRPFPPERTQYSPELIDWAASRTDSATAAARRFFADKDLDVDPAWAVRTFRLGEQGGNLWLPYWQVAGGREGGGRHAVSVKIRWLDASGEWRKRQRGPQRGVLYGEWRDRGQRWVVLCEGETDTIAVAWWLRAKTDILVVGVPGASMNPSERNLPYLAGRTVVILPDADAAGAGMAARWAAAARHAAAESVSVAQLPAGTDACSASRKTVRRALRAAVRKQKAPATPSRGFPRPHGG